MDDGRFHEPNQQHLLDFESCFSGDDLSRTLSSLSAAAATASSTGNVDRLLFNDLVEMVPLIQSLIDRKANSAYTRRGSMVFTKAPCRECLYNKDKEELMTLSEQVEDLKRQLSEKDERLKSLELTKGELASIRVKFDELNNVVEEKDLQIKSTNLQLFQAKVKLADRQAALEKLQWVATTSREKEEKLQKDLDKMDGDISSFMILIQGLARDDSPVSAGDYDVFDSFDSNDELDDEIDVQKLEDAREAYIAAVAVAKEKQDDASMSAAADARLRLQSFVLKQI